MKALQLRRSRSETAASVPQISFCLRPVTVSCSPACEPHARVFSPPQEQEKERGGGGEGERDGGGRHFCHSSVPVKGTSQGCLFRRGVITRQRHQPITDESSLPETSSPSSLFSASSPAWLAKDPHLGANPRAALSGPRGLLNLSQPTISCG